MFLLQTSKHYHIIYVDDAIHQIQLPQSVLHEALEGHQNVTESKGHRSELIEPQITHGESGILLRLWHHPNLPEPALKIHHRVMHGACHALQCLLYPQQRIGVFLYTCIESTEIHAEA